VPIRYLNRKLSCALLPRAGGGHEKLEGKNQIEDLDYEHRAANQKAAPKGKLKQLEVTSVRHCLEAGEKNQDFATHQSRA
jgi:hypothetical protein